MESIKEVSLQHLTDNFKDLALQEGYIHVPDFRISESLTEPYRSNYYCIGFLKEGELVIHSNLIRHEVKAPAIVFADPVSIKNWEMPELPYKAESILISEDFLQEKIIESNILKGFSNLSGNGTFIVQLRKKEAEHIKSIFKLISSYTPPRSIFHKEIVHGSVYSLVNITADIRTEQGNITPSTNSLSLRFRKAVTEYATQERELQFYADLLNIHPKYLSQVIRKETGRTPGEWIQHQIILEAKIMLQKEEMSIGTIAEHLNFPDQSTFGKYFKKYSETNPSEYRHYIQGIQQYV
ncbi:helix-turn-helix domain-containing protein [Chryseobacterium sp. c4a]|uniref:helix-turn-helix domain-containing protein n=1 Tax=Chryseobacterium sp. c4a TaxID=1573582 RepID=UPI001357355E|nr:helix-turn-helix transcriptional regulator [Chryseobacterium sp. c4a]